MKKLLLILLTLCLVILMAACGGKDDDDGMIGKENDQALNGVNFDKIDYVGKWVNTHERDFGAIVTLNSDGTGTMEMGGEMLDLHWEEQHGLGVFIDNGKSKITYKATNTDVGIRLAPSSDTGVVLITEKSFEKKYEKVTLTLDNWRDYFGMNTYSTHPDPEFVKENQLFGIDFALYPNNKYEGRLAAARGKVESCHSDMHHCSAQYDLKTGRVFLLAPYTGYEDEQKGYGEDPHTDDVVVESIVVLDESASCIPLSNPLSYFLRSFEIKGDFAYMDVRNYDSHKITAIDVVVYFTK